MAVIHGSKLALVKALSYQLWLHGFHIRAGWSPDGPKHRWGRQNCMHPSRQTCPQGWSILHRAGVQYLLLHMLPLLHPAARLGAHRFHSLFRAYCIGCVKYQSRRETMVLQSSRGHIPLTTKYIFLLKLGSGSLHWHVLHYSLFCLAWSRAQGIGVVMLSHGEYTSVAWTFLYHIKLHHLKKKKKGKMQQARHHAILPWGWDRKERAASDRCHLKHHLQMVMLCSVQDTCIMHLHKLNWVLPYPHTYTHALTSLSKSRPNGQLFHSTVPAYYQCFV